MTRDERSRDERSRDEASDWIAASSIGGPDSGRLDAFLNDLRTLAAGPPPAPSAELDAMLAGVVAPVIPAHRARRHRKTIAGAFIMGSIGAGLSGAAAAEERPRAPAHRVHSHVVPETAPPQGEPIGAPDRARQSPEPLRPKLVPARPVPQGATPTPTPPPSRTDDLAGDDQVTEHDGSPDQEDGTEHEHEHEHDEGTPGRSD